MHGASECDCTIDQKTPRVYIGRRQRRAIHAPVFARTEASERFD
jgi:hypothetical protein